MTDDPFPYNGLPEVPDDDLPAKLARGIVYTIVWCSLIVAGTGIFLSFVRG